MKRCPSRPWPWLALLCVWLTPQLAGAQASAQDRATAEALFREAKTLMGKKSYPDACRKLEESQRLDPQDGTLLNLAVCHAREGKTASAWAEFQSALQQARDSKRKDRERLALREVRRLERRLSRLTIEVPEETRVPGLTVTRAGSKVGEAAWGTAVPVDPGNVEIQLAAPGYRDRTLQIAIEETEEKTVSLEKLEPLPKPPPPEPEKPDPAVADAAKRAEESRQTKRTFAYVAGGVGIVAAGVGAYFGLRALSKNSESDDRCNGALCDPKGLELADEADSAATVSNVAFAVGAVGIGAGAYLFFTSMPGGEPKADARHKARFGASIGADRASIVVSGAW